MKKYLSLLIMFVLLISCGGEQEIQEIEDAASDETAQEASLKFTQVCADPMSALIEKLNDMQKPETMDFIVPGGIRNRIVSTYEECIELVERMISTTQKNFPKTKANEKCNTALQEVVAEIPEMRKLSNTVSSANLGTKEGRGEAYLTSGGMSVFAVAMHGRLTMNYELTCKYSKFLGK